MKLSKISDKNKQYLREVLYHAERAQEYIARKDILVCCSSRGTTTQEYKHVKEDKFITPMNKEYGSNLCGLQDVISKLNYMLELV